MSSVGCQQCQKQSGQANENEPGIEKNLSDSLKFEADKVKLDALTPYTHSALQVVYSVLLADLGKKASITTASELSMQTN